MADKVELCLVAEDGSETRVTMPEVDGYVWHCYLPHRAARAAGTATGCTDLTNPASGARCNPNKLLLDPYAKAVAGRIDWNQAVFSYNLGHPGSRNDEDSAPHMMHAVVINPFFDWSGDRMPHIPYSESVIYEGACQGYDRVAPRDTGEPAPGTYAGLSHPAVIDHLTASRGHRPSN